MKNLLFVIVLITFLALAFLGLNAIWDWIVIPRRLILNIALTSGLVFAISTALYVLKFVTYHKDENHLDVGKKETN